MTMPVTLSVLSEKTANLERQSYLNHSFLYIMTQRILTSLYLREG